MCSCDEYGVCPPHCRHRGHFVHPDFERDTPVTDAEERYKTMAAQGDERAQAFQAAQVSR